MVLNKNWIKLHKCNLCDKNNFHDYNLMQFQYHQISLKSYISVSSTNMSKCTEKCMPAEHNFMMEKGDIRKFGQRDFLWYMMHRNFSGYYIFHQLKSTIIKVQDTDHVVLCDNYNIFCIILFLTKSACFCFPEDKQQMGYAKKSRDFVLGRQILKLGIFWGIKYEPLLPTPIFPLNY